MTEKKTKKPWFKRPPPLGKNAHIAIIGAGISGVSLAHHLDEAGFKVTLIDKNSSLLSEASSNPAGILDPFLSITSSIESNFYFQAYHYALDFYKNLGPGIFKQCGLIKIARDPTEKEKFEKIANAYPQDMLSLKGDRLILNKSGYLIPAAISGAISKNINILLNSNVSRLECGKGGGWSLFYHNNDFLLSADAVILSASHYVNKFDQAGHINLDKVSGQISYISPACDESSVLCSEGYLTPPIRTPSGMAHILGATFDRNSDLNLSEKSHSENLKKSPYLFSKPEIIGGKRAIRSMSKDHLPLAGPVADYNDYLLAYKDLHHGPAHKSFPNAPYHKNLFSCVGLGARGFLSAPLLGKYFSTLLKGESLPFSEKTYHSLHPARFIVRKLSKK